MLLVGVMLPPAGFYTKNMLIKVILGCNELSMTL